MRVSRASSALPGWSADRTVSGSTAASMSFARRNMAKLAMSSFVSPLESTSPQVR